MSLASDVTAILNSIDEDKLAADPAIATKLLPLIQAIHVEPGVPDEQNQLIRDLVAVIRGLANILAKSTPK